MSSAFFPLGMNSMPASGYTHRSTYYNQQYASWKGTGVNSNPVTMAAGHIRPLTNNDPGNNFPTGFGLPRPLKHYRKGRVIPVPVTQSAEVADNEYNYNRYVRSSKGTSLGGGFGGSGLLNEMLDKPGAYIVKENPLDEVDETTQAQQDCRTCEGVAGVATYYPNKTYLTNNPEPVTTNPRLCCNEERKAKRRVVYASTNLKKNYYTTHKQYMQNRCQTYEQKAFNFVPPAEQNVVRDNTFKPGSPEALALANLYLANCYPNAEIYEGTEFGLTSKALAMMCSNGLLTPAQCTTLQEKSEYTFQGLYDAMVAVGASLEAIAFYDAFIDNPYWGVPPQGPSNPVGCKLTVYKPNNYQFAKQGAVSSGTRNLKLNVNTISTNAASIQNNNNTGQQLVTAEELYRGNDPAAYMLNVQKNKYTKCQIEKPQPFQNKKNCYFTRQLPEYQVPISQPSPYRYYPGTVFTTNHFAQSPNRYLNTTGTR